MPNLFDDQADQYTDVTAKPARKRRPAGESPKRESIDLEQHRYDWIVVRGFRSWDYPIDTLKLVIDQLDYNELQDVLAWAKQVAKAKG